MLKKGWGEKDIFWAVNYLFFLCNFTCLFICTDRFLAFTIAKKNFDVLLKLHFFYIKWDIRVVKHLYADREGSFARSAQ